MLRKEFVIKQRTSETRRNETKIRSGQAGMHTLVHESKYFAKFRGSKIILRTKVTFRLVGSVLRLFNILSKIHRSTMKISDIVT